MPPRGETANYQRALSRSCLTGEFEEIPGVSEGKAKVYRNLVLGGISDALERAYPIAKELLISIPSDVARYGNRWKELVGEFVSKHPSPSPELWRMPEGLLHFAIENGLSAKWQLPYLYELLEFEWIEIELHMMEDLARPEVGPVSNPMREPLVLNPEYRLLHFSYPVFRLRGEELLNSRGNYFLLVYRHPDTLEVRFIELGAVLALAVEALSAEILSGDEILANITNLVGNSCNGSVVSPTDIETQLRGLLQERVILGGIKR